MKVVSRFMWSWCYWSNWFIRSCWFMKYPLLNVTWLFNWNLDGYAHLFVTQRVSIVGLHRQGNWHIKSYFLHIFSFSGWYKPLVCCWKVFWSFKNSTARNMDIALLFQEGRAETSSYSKLRMAMVGATNEWSGNSNSMFFNL